MEIKKVYTSFNILLLCGLRCYHEINIINTRNVIRHTIYHVDEKLVNFNIYTSAYLMTTMRQAIRYLVSLYVKDLPFCLKPYPN